jgi:hypothetical protein
MRGRWRFVFFRSDSQGQEGWKRGNEVVESCGAWNRHGKWSEGNHSGDACAAGCTFWKNAIPLSVLDSETA